jgi:hypothetical protein
MDWLGSGALPIGFLMFFGMVYAFVKRRASHRLASRAFPDLAKRLGLCFTPSPYKKGIGTLSGSIDGYRVFVDPDEQRKISLHFKSDPSVLLLSYHENRRPPDGAERLYSGDRIFDGFFKTRYASEAVAVRLRGRRELGDLLIDLNGTFRRALKQCSVSSTGIGLVLDFGNPPYIPASAVRRLLPPMIQLAKVIDPYDATAPSSGPSHSH